MIYFCSQRNRRTLVLANPPLNGIDYLEVADGSGQTVLLLTFLRDPTPLALGPAQIAILGGESIAGISVLDVAPQAGNPLTLAVQLDQAGDFSTYTLELRADEQTDEPPDGLDPALATLDFSFKAGCPSTGDCATSACCPPTPVAPPDINYLARDYPGFVQVMLDRMAVLAPGWTERHAADLGVALVEVLAYVADHLSYRQDAVGTEAYLGTARSRISLRRHARLVDYRVDEGENARAWVQFQADAEGVALPAGTPVAPRVAGVPARLDPADPAAQQILAAGGAVFATLADATLNASLNDIPFHTWSDQDCCLPAGSTAATLAGHLDALSPGDVLLFEEVLGPETGRAEDADATHRCAVRLTRVHHTDRLGRIVTDPLTGDPVTDIEWDTADALPFALCLSATTDAAHGGVPIDAVSLARGNMVPADHGVWPAAGQWESLGTVPDPPEVPVGSDTGDCCAPPVAVLAPLPVFVPALQQAPLTFARAYDPTAAASALGAPPATDAPPPTPQIAVQDDSNLDWLPQPDLLGLHELDRGFVVEIERDGTAYLRFGDGEYGAAPEPGESFRARYRIGNGAAGNLGNDTLGHVVTTETRISGVRNPLPARGGRDPDTMETIRQLAPFGFRTQLRAVTETDYGTAAMTDPAVRAARGTLRWTGSWRTAFVAIDPAPSAPATLAADTETRLDLERMAGVDLATESAAIVGLRVGLAICLAPYYARSDVEAALRRVFSAGPTCDGRPGLLDPSNFTFGQTVYLSPFIAAAQEVPGVAAVRATAFQRVDDPASDALAAGALTMQRLEIPRLDNDPSRPDRGILDLVLDGGG
ncbi:MAG TPA: hypothetical protein VME92_01815 [Acetobacteraceae bacterium]|nr:hypothetical protein [Acetobacteraceae bacterium]